MASPNMGLTIPSPTITSGPQYAQEISNSFDLIDSHNHTSGQGSLIPLNALTISQNLNMNSYSVTNLKSVSLVNQISAPAENGSVYMTGDNLYWKDGTGSYNVQITNGNSLAGAAGTITGLPTGTASAAYLSGSGTFRFQSSTNTGADVDCRTVTLRNNVALSFGMQVLPPALAANVQVTMPLPPLTTKLLSMTSAGALNANIDADNTTIEIVTNNLQVKDDGITTAKILNGAVTNAKLASPNGGYSTTTINVSGAAVSSPLSLIVGADTTITTTRNNSYILCIFQPGDDPIFGPDYGSVGINGQIRIYLGSTVALAGISQRMVGGSTYSQPIMGMVQAATAGAHTIRLYFNSISGSGTININQMQMILKEVF